MTVLSLSKNLSVLTSAVDSLEVDDSPVSEQEPKCPHICRGQFGG